MSQTADAAQIWFPSRRPRPDAKVQLFCFPFAGGGASAYMRWHDHLPSSVDPWALEYPGHETRFREPAIDRADVLAKEIAKRIAAAVDRPFALFGHSMGALLAFETARALMRDHGLRPQALFVAGFSAPQLPPFRPPVRDLPEAEFRNELRRYGGTPEEILADEDFMQFISPLLRNDLGLCETYRHLEGRPLDVPLIAFGGCEDPTVPWHRLLAWSELTSSTFAAHFLPGEHFFIRSAAPRMGKLISKVLEAPGNRTSLAQPDFDEAHLWAVRIDQAGAAAANLKRTLSDGERQRAAAFVRQDDQMRSIVSRAALRDVLGHYKGLAPASLSFGVSSTDKPQCEAAKPLQFNVSHSGLMALIAVTVAQCVGVDVEHIRDDAYSPTLARQFATSHEIVLLDSISSDRKKVAFFDLWVRKEAYLKRTGEGFARAATATEVGLSPQFSRSQKADAKAASRQIQSFTLASGYAAAIAAERPMGLTTVRVWSPDIAKRA